MVEGLAIGLPADEIDKAVVLFSRLAVFFQSGLFLEETQNRWRPQALFKDGHASSLPANLTDRSIELPPSKAFEVIRTQAEPLLQKLGLQKHVPCQSERTYLIRPIPGVAYLLWSDLPDLWLKDHLEKVVMALAKGFAD